jgi:hypothetical protein
MTALKEALRSAIEEWNGQYTQPKPESEPAQDTQPKPSKAKILFDYILANPGKTLKEITTAMVAQGVGASTADSYVYQMIRAGHIHRDANNTLHSLQPEYEPIRLLAAVATMEYPSKLKKNKPGPKPKAKLKPRPKPKTTYPIEELKPAPAPAHALCVHVQQKPNTVEQDVEMIMSMLNVRTAHQLRKALNEMFK